MAVESTVVPTSSGFSIPTSLRTPLSAVIIFIGGILAFMMVRQVFAQPCTHTVGTGVSLHWSCQDINDYRHAMSNHKQTIVKLSSHQLRVEIVSTPESIAQGLSGRSEIGSDGMLFMMPSVSQHRFWMKDMKMDLDIIWLKDNTIVGITPQVPRPRVDTPLVNLPIYTPNVPADMVLEVKSGRTQFWNLSTGDKLEFLTE
jgi:uncharacterized membrane protein (UPF0127 family)